MTSRFKSAKIPCYSFLKDKVVGLPEDSSSDMGSAIDTPISTENEGDGS